MKIPGAIRSEKAWLSLDLFVALAILAVAVLPLAYSFVGEARMCRAAYYRAVAMEVVDGEMEFLAAGEYKSFERGVHSYMPESEAARQLPGHFQLSVDAERVRLEWQPAQRGQGSAIVREISLP